MKKFIYGIITGFILISILDELTNLIISLFELPKAVITKKILRENKVINELQTDLEKTDDGVAIGFDLSQQEEFYDDDDFEDKKKK